MDINITVQNMREEIIAHRGWYIFEGILFLIMGLLAILLPGLTAIAITLIVGAFLLMGGAAQTISFFRYPKRWMKLLSGFLFIAGGLAVAFFPLVGLATLAILVGIILLLEGFFEVIFSLAFKPFPGWGWMMFSGIIAFVLALLVMIGFPATTMIFLAVAVGLNMGTYGISILMLVLKTKE